ncbi:MAG: putative aliphatic sulfonates transport permease protein SsuC [Alphaproteobacteria bacterium MarineAlpha3_Bin7]|nr:MAG: putative aliphatic sulfonates transport permease protein SsuC [Alphaproteobacteria bacterium MarineAlpha3_Bin7]
MTLQKLIKIIAIFISILLIWQIVVTLTSIEHYILPSPNRVLIALNQNYGILYKHSVITFSEIILGLILGVGLGFFSALLMGYYKLARDWLMPIVVISQAIPVFALAPILVLWIGYGLASKIAMATIIIYFPITAALLDGLIRTNKEQIYLAKIMGASSWSIIKNIKLPSAMPSFASGVRIGAAVAPIGAVVGEWVGSSGGLGYLMLHANAKMQIDLMFAALFILALIATLTYFSIDKLMKNLIYWSAQS